MKTTGISLRTAILAPLSLALAALLSFLVISSILEARRINGEHVTNRMMTAYGILEQSVRLESERLSTALEIVGHDAALRTALRDGNREELLNRSTPLFKRLREQFHITHFYFSSAQRVNLLRVHEPERHGDVVDRWTTLRAQATNQPASGLELGSLGLFTLRVVHPWHEAGQLIGYVELGMDFEHLLSHVKDLAGVEFYVTIRKSLLSRSNWVSGMAMLGRTPDWEQLPDRVIATHTTQRVSPAMRHLLADTASASKEIQDDGTYLRTLMLPLHDAAQREVGQLLISRDISVHRQQVSDDAWIVIGVGAGALILILGLLYLITGRAGRKMEFSRRALSESEARFRSLVESSNDMIWEIDAASRFVYVSPKIRELLGYEASEVLGKTPFDLMPPHETQRIASQFADIRNRRAPFAGLVNINLHKQGYEVVLEANGTPILDEQGALCGYRGINRDITERQNFEQQLEYLAYHDDLTGLPNRTLFTNRLALATADAERHERIGAVLFMDMDSFKIINDTLGHAAGNDLLKEVSVRLTSCFREGDTVARLGGDEFAVILPNISHVNDAIHVARKIQEAFKLPCTIAGQEIYVTLSIGITLFPLDDSSVQRLLRNADSAMYQAKANGRNNFQFYSADMTARASHRMAIETGLRRALERKEFVLHYQPQLDLRTGRVIGVEALVRWNHPELGLLQPGEFISVAEDTGLIVPLGAWVLREACAQASAWRAQGMSEFLLAINLSPRQFRSPHLTEQVAQALHDSGLPAHGLELEITESLLIDGADSTVAGLLDNFKRMGIWLAIDDFGTGYSSLSYLKRFPIDKLKIDRSFVHGITSSADDASLVDAMIAMGRSLRLKVIAEGVDSAEQVLFLRRHGCDQMQGYFFSQPVPAEELAQLLDTGTSLTQMVTETTWSSL